MVINATFLNALLLAGYHPFTRLPNLRGFCALMHSLPEISADCFLGRSDSHILWLIYVCSNYLFSVYQRKNYKNSSLRKA